MTWPLVRRRRLHDAEGRLACAYLNIQTLQSSLNATKLTVEVLESEVHHLTDRRLEYVNTMAGAAMEIHQLTKDLDEAKTDRDRWRAKYERNPFV
jgi:chromosome segregation ATPase